MKLCWNCKSGVFVLLIVFLSDSSVGGTGLKIFPEQNGKPLVRTVGKSFALTCQLDSDQADNDDLKWEKDGSEIPLNSQASVKAKKINDHKLMVYSTKAETRDSGTYVCRSGQLSKEIQLAVFEPATWFDASEKVGSNVGTRLTVSCQASGSPAPKIRISNKDNAPFNEQRYDVSDGVLTVTALQESDQDKAVVCTAAQTFHVGGFSYPHIEKKVVTMDVYLEPEFESARIERFGIAGRNASLPCKVLKTNPALTEFEFYEFVDGQHRQIPRNSDKYSIEEDLKKNKAVLHIKKVEEEDFGEYMCLARNPKAQSSDFFISLSPTSPPGPVQAKCMQTSSNSVSWSLEVSEEPGSLPVTEFRVEYIREELIENKEPQEIEEIWKTEARKVHFKKEGEKALYTVDALRPRTTYKFRFRAVNEAGWGDLQDVGVATVSAAEDPTSVGSPVRHLSSLPLLLIESMFVCLCLSILRT